MNKIIDSSHYHIWSDALHLRELARQTTDRWDKATYIRASVIMAWTAFETALAEALPAERLGGRFKDNLDGAVAKAGLKRLEWGHGVWQKVAKLNARRVDYVHRTAEGTDLFPDANVAYEAFQVIRDALRQLHAGLGSQPPEWLEDDGDRGWMGGTVHGDKWRATVTHAGVDRNAPDTLRLVYVDAGGEQTEGYYGPDSDAQQLADELLNRMNVPVTHVRVYRGQKLELEITAPPMRGSP